MLSIIIPVYNEAVIITTLLNHLSDNISGENSIEILLVDGGSQDETRKLIQSFSEQSKIAIRLILSEKGRAKQMNTGAQNAQGDVLYFLHADSLPPKNFDNYIIAEVENGNPAGCFRMEFSSSHWWLKLMGWFTKFSWRACRGGDQSQFITKQLFDEIGGYDESFVIYEDNILINELYARKKFVVVPHTLTTSARLYNQKGIWNLQYHFWVIYMKRWMGADAETLHAYYLKNIKVAPCKSSTHSAQDIPQKALDK